MLLGIFQRTGVVPLIVIDMIGGNHGSRSVRTAPTVHEYRSRRRIFQHSQNPGDFGVGWGN